MTTGGFSILEMMIVLVLAGFLLGVFLVRLRGLGDQKDMETARGDLRAIQTAIHAYYLNHNKTYPEGADWQNNDLVNDDPRILRQVLYDPFRSPDTEYSYFRSSNGIYYVAFSYGPDKSPDITGIGDDGQLTGQNDDDMFVSNGSGSFGS